MLTNMNATSNDVTSMACIYNRNKLETIPEY